MPTRIAIVGPGATGGWLACRLGQLPRASPSSNDGVELLLISGGRAGDAIRSRGIRLRVTGGNGTVEEVGVAPPRFDLCSSVGEALSRSSGWGGTVDYVVLGVRSWEVRGAASEVGPLLRKGNGDDDGDGGSSGDVGEGCVVTFQNGIDSPDAVAAGLGSRAAVIGGVAKCVSHVPSPGVVEMRGPPAPCDLLLGEVFSDDGDGVDEAGAIVTQERTVSARVGRLHRILSSCVGVNCRIAEPSIWSELWKKAIFMATVGPVAALCRCPSQRLVAIPETRELLNAALREAASCAEAAGHLGPGESPVGVAQGILEYLSKAAPGSAPSTLQDIVLGRPSEVRQLTGGIIAAGERHGVSTPTHRMVLAALLPQELRARGEGPYKLAGVPGGAPHVYAPRTMKK